MSIAQHADYLPQKEFVDWLQAIIDLSKLESVDASKANRPLAEIRLARAITTFGSDAQASKNPDRSRMVYFADQVRAVLLVNAYPCDLSAWIKRELDDVLAGDRDEREAA